LTAQRMRMPEHAGPISKHKNVMCSTKNLDTESLAAIC